jgi:AAA domain
MSWAMDDPDDDIAGFNRAMDANRPGQAIRAVVQGGAVTDPSGKPVLWSDAGAWDEAALTPRPWVVPGYAMRGAVTVVAGMGSAGKSTLMVGWAIAAALGTTLGRFAPIRPSRVMLYNVEDDADEQRRRLSAGLRSAGAAPRDIAGKVIRCGPNGVGTLIDRDLGTGQIVLTAGYQALEALIQQYRPDIAMLDPLVELHTAEENDNTALRLVVAHLRELAQKHRIAILLIHHTRKGATAGDVDSIRGATSLIGAARAAYTVTPMSEGEAEELGISMATRRGFVRVDTVKGNYAPAQEADWHELVEHELDNGEQVAAIVPWRAPVAAAGPTPEAMALITTELERGTAGGPYSPRLAPDQARSVAPLLAKHGITSPAAQKKAMKAILAEGFSVQPFRTANGDERNGIRAPSGLPVAKWVEA